MQYNNLIFKMEEYKDIIFVIVVGTWAMAAVFLFTPSAIKGLNVIAENVCSTSINVDLTSQYVTSSLCKFILIATGLTIFDILCNGIFYSDFSYVFASLLKESDVINYSVANTILPVLETAKTIVSTPIKYTSLNDSIMQDLIFLNELKPVTTILNSSAYGLLNTTILIKAFNNGFFLMWIF